MGHKTRWLIYMVNFGFLYIWKWRKGVRTYILRERKHPTLLNYHQANNSSTHTRKAHMVKMIQAKYAWFTILGTWPNVSRKYQWPLPFFIICLALINSVPPLLTSSHPYYLHPIGLNPCHPPHDRNHCNHIVIYIHLPIHQENLSWGIPYHSTHCYKSSICQHKQVFMAFTRLAY